MASPREDTAPRPDLSGRGAFVVAAVAGLVTVVLVSLLSSLYARAALNVVRAAVFVLAIFLAPTGESRSVAGLFDLRGWFVLAWLARSLAASAMPEAMLALAGLAAFGAGDRGEAAKDWVARLPRPSAYPPRVLFATLALLLAAVGLGGLAAHARPDAPLWGAYPLRAATLLFVAYRMRPRFFRSPVDVAVVAGAMTLLGVVGRAADLLSLALSVAALWQWYARPSRSGGAWVMLAITAGWFWLARKSAPPSLAEVHPLTCLAALFFAGCAASFLRGYFREHKSNPGVGLLYALSLPLAWTGALGDPRAIGAEVLFVAAPVLLVLRLVTVRGPRRGPLGAGDAEALRYA